jgi:hypothetical protein
MTIKNYEDYATNAVANVIENDIVSAWGFTVTLDALAVTLRRQVNVNDKENAAAYEAAAKHVDAAAAVLVKAGI